MKLFRCLFFVALLTGSHCVRADYIAVVDPHSIIVTNFEGWGTSLCWWANVVGAYSNRNDFVDLAFNKLKLNIVRYNIGGGENPAATNTITHYRAAMQGFEPTNGVWDWNADVNQRWVLRQAIAHGVNRVVAFANSPPWWMTISGSVTGAVDGTNNLRVEYERPFAAYLATVVSNLTVLDDVHFDYVTPVNEPNSSWWTYADGKQEGCHIDADQQARIINYLRTELDARNLQAVGIDAPEDNTEAGSVSDLNSYGRATNNVALLATHTYTADDPAGIRNASTSLARPAWISEYGDGSDDGLAMAQRIHDDITQSGARAWIYWQVVDGGGWGFLRNRLTTNFYGGFRTNYVINEKYYVMAQFSEFIRPGARIISVNDSNTLAAYNPTNSTLVLVAVNTNSTPLKIIYDLKAFDHVPGRAVVYQTADDKNLSQLEAVGVSNAQFSATLPAYSVTTFVLTNVVTEPGWRARKDADFCAFFRQTNHWAAGDVATSIPLSDGRVLWFFGDCYIDQFNPVSGTVPCLFSARNSVMVQNTNDLIHPQTLARFDAADKSFFRPPDAGDTNFWPCFWPAAGFQDGNNIYVYLTEIQKTPTGGMWGFKNIGQWWGKMSFPDLKVTGYVKLPSFNGIQFSCGFVPDERSSFTYAFGNKRRGTASEVYVARFKSASPEGGWEFWGGGGWTGNVTNAAIIARGKSTSVSVCRVKGKFQLITTAFSVACDQGRDIFAMTSDTATGPFSKPEKIFSVDDTVDGHYPFFYLAIPHPEFINADGLLITYCINGYAPCVPTCVNGRMNPDYYRPRAIRLPL